jgi:hypothetical protein
VKHNASVISMHIPPIEISSGSVILQTKGHAQVCFQDHLILQTKGPFEDKDGSTSADYDIKYVFPENKQIIRVRVINTDGSILADMVDHHNEHMATGGIIINLWVDNTKGTTIDNHPDMVLETEGQHRTLQLRIGDGDHKFNSDMRDGSTSHKKYRFMCNSETSLMKVRILKPDGDAITISSDPDNEQEIDRILIWTE